MTAIPDDWAQAVRSEALSGPQPHDPLDWLGPEMDRPSHRGSNPPSRSRRRRPSRTCNGPMVSGRAAVSAICTSFVQID